MTQQFLDDMSLNEKIKGMSDREVSEEALRQIYETRKHCLPCQTMVSKHERVLTRMGGAIVILSILFTAYAVAVIAKII